MSREALEYLYVQYKSCLRKELEDYLGRSDSYKSYGTQCENQRDDIIEYIQEISSKPNEFEKVPEHLMEEKVEEYSFKMAPYGYDTQFARNM